MNTKGFSSLVTILLAIGIIIVGGAVWYFGPHTTTRPIEQPQIVGGDKDAHGCIGSAGYQWCDAKQKCLRVWEEYCGPSDLNGVFDILTAIRYQNSGVFGYATSSVFEWRFEDNATTTVQGLAINAIGARDRDYELVEKYFSDNGFSASNADVAGGSTGGVTEHQKDSLICISEFTFSDLADYSDQPTFRINSDTQNITVSCGISSSQSRSIFQVGTSDWRTYTSTQYGFSFRYPPTFNLSEQEDTRVMILLPQRQPIEFGPYMQITVVETNTDDVLNATQKIFGKDMMSYYYRTINGRKYLHAFVNQYFAGPDAVQTFEYYFTDVGNSKVLKITYSPFYKEYFDEYSAIMGSLTTR